MPFDAFSFFGICRLSLRSIDSCYPEYRDQRIKIIGGGAKSSIWPQMLADVTGKTFERLDREDTATWGAALLAAKGAGEITSIHDIAKRHICVKEIFEPDAEKVKIYQPYIDFYDKLKKEMHNMFYEFGRFRGNQ